MVRNFFERNFCHHALFLYINLVILQYKITLTCYKIEIILISSICTSEEQSSYLRETLCKAFSQFLLLVLEKNTQIR